jgi:hypothetical protein
MGRKNRITLWGVFQEMNDIILGRTITDTIGRTLQVAYKSPTVIITGQDTTIQPIETEFNWYMSDGSYCRSSRSTFYVVV